MSWTAIKTPRQKQGRISASSTIVWPRLLSMCGPHIFCIFDSQKTVVLSGLTYSRGRFRGRNQRRGYKDHDRRFPQCFYLATKEVFQEWDMHQNWHPIPRPL